MKIPMVTYPQAQKTPEGINASPAIQFDNSGGDVVVSQAATDSDGYISAVLVRNGTGSHMYFAKISGNDSYNTEKFSCEYSQTITDDSMHKLSGDLSCFPASIAAGDFSNDGYRNEVALTWSDIVATIYSVSVAAGNFDGVSGDEFAVVFRDNNPDNANGI